MHTGHKPLQLSLLPKTWILDIDGTIFKHNGYLKQDNALLPGISELFRGIGDEDIVILLTARDEVYRMETECALAGSGLRWNYLIMGVPHGERILINDKKPSGLITAYAVNVERDGGIPPSFFVRKNNL
ncbi:MAG: hypothetical protein N3I35_10055 [Clostridia bacterium]|nr:hypothetical protein [Clostridia bacterium]